MKIRIFEWLRTWVYKNLKTKNQKCWVVPIIAKEDLKDGEFYEALIADTKNPKWRYWITVKWNTEFGCFIEKNGDHNALKYEDVIIVVENHRGLKWGEVLDYNPHKINQLDLQALEDICFRLADDNTHSEDIWEALIEYFEKRGINPED